MAYKHRNLSVSTIKHKEIAQKNIWEITQYIDPGHRPSGFEQWDDVMSVIVQQIHITIREIDKEIDVSRNLPRADDILRDCMWKVRELLVKDGWK